MKRFSRWVLLVFAAIPHSGVAQESQPESINSGRPGFNETLGIIPAWRVQQEMGYVFTRDGSSREHGVGQMIRIGTGGGTEAQIGINSYVMTRGTGGHAGGLEDSSIGFKVKLAEEGARFRLLQPAIALVAGSSLPTGVDAEKQWQPQSKLALGWTLTERLAVSSTLASSYASQNQERFWQRAGGLSLAYGLTSKVGCYAEYFGYVPDSSKGSNSNFVGGGITYLAGSTLQLDLNWGHRLNTEASTYFLGTGLSKLW